MSNILQEFIYDYLKNNITAESKKLVTVAGKPPRIVGSRDIPNQIAIFIASAKKNTILIIEVDSESDTSDITSPPRTVRQSYAAVASKGIKNVEQPPRASILASTPSHNNENFSTASSTQFSTLSTRIDDVLNRIKSNNKSLSDNQSKIDDEVSVLSSRVSTIATEFEIVQSTLKHQSKTLDKLSKSHNSILQILLSMQKN